VGQGVLGRPPDVAVGDRRATVEGRECTGRPGGRDVRPVAVDARVETEGGDLAFLFVGQRNRLEEIPGRTQTLAVAVGVVLDRRRTLQVAVDDGDAVLDVAFALDFDREREAIPELWPEIALLGVHRPDERELGGMGDADAVALDAVLAGGRGVQQHVHEVIVQQVHLVDVQQPPVGAGEQSGVEGGLAGQRVRDRERPDDALSGGPQRERHERDGTGLDGKRRPLATRLALSGPVVGRTAIRAVGDGPLIGQEIRQPPDERRFGRPLLAGDEQAIEAVVDRDGEKRLLQPFLADDRAERRGNAFHGGGIKHSCISTTGVY
jgi:hypothetical protein